MGLFSSEKEPIILNETSNAKQQIQELEGFLRTAPENIKPQIEQEIKLLSYGIFGEEQVLFELKNSHMPMYVLHDLYLEDEGLAAQIDFLIISKKEGIYSPITQNRRHIELIKQIRRRTKSNILTKALFEKNFYTSYQSIVVLANPRTVLDDKYAKKEIKEQVIRVDRLVEHIRQVNASSKNDPSSDKQMKGLAQFYLTAHKEKLTDYLAKYKKAALIENDTDEPAAEKLPDLLPGIEKGEAPTADSKEYAPACPKCSAQMILRTATKGVCIGKKFWGCSNYPKCRSIINIEEK